MDIEQLAAGLELLETLVDHYHELDDEETGIAAHIDCGDGDLEDWSDLSEINDELDDLVEEIVDLCDDLGVDPASLGLEDL
jgi:hypothetical protein